MSKQRFDASGCDLKAKHLARTLMVPLFMEQGAQLSRYGNKRKGPATCLIISAGVKCEVCNKYPRWSCARGILI
jgi:hypothetical protein